MTNAQHPGGSRPVIRPARPGDAEGMAKVGREAFLQAFAHSCSEKDMSDFLEAHYTPEKMLLEVTESPHRHYLVAEMEGAVVGFSSLDTASDENCLTPYPNRIELSRIYVDNNHHGSGVGGALAKEILEMAKGMGKEWIWLGVWEHNMKARRFYDKLGFEKVGEHVFMVGEDAQTDWIVVKRL